MSKLQLFHGSVLCVREPKLLPVTRRLDFGPGFYTTTDFNQAMRWAMIKKNRMQADEAIVSIYRCEDLMSSEMLSVQVFETATEQWLDFVMLNRMGTERTTLTYDIIRGPVANDTLYETLALFERGILTHGETVVRLRTHKLADQVVFATERSLSLLKFIECREVF